MLQQPAAPHLQQEASAVIASQQPAALPAEPQRAQAQGRSRNAHEDLPGTAAAGLAGLGSLKSEAPDSQQPSSQAAAAAAARLATKVRTLEASKRQLRQL